MTTKQWPMAFGERGKSEPDLAFERIKQAQADRQTKKMERDDKLEDVEHQAKLSEAEAKEAEAKRKAEEAKAGHKPESPITFKPVEVDIQRGEKEADGRAKRAEEEAQREREEHGKTREELAGERQKRLEDKLSDLTGELKEIRGGKGTRTADEVIDEAVKTAEKLGYAKGGTPIVAPEVQVQLQQMQDDLQVRLEEMKDDRDRRDKEWQLTLKKWEDEKEMKRAELGQKAEAENKKMEFLNTTIKRLGGAIATGVMSGGGGSPMASEPEKTFFIEAGEGEEGETACPKCGESIFIAPDAARAICANCGLTAEVRRTPTKAKAKKGE